MGRAKVCRVCKEILYCKICGERQTPESPDWQQVLLRITPERKKMLEEKAKEEGMPMTEYIRQKLNLEEDEVQDDD